MNENQAIHQKNRQTLIRAFENLSSVLNESVNIGGIKYILKFLNEKAPIDNSMSLSEQLAYAQNQLNIFTRYVELDDDWYKNLSIPMLVKDINQNWVEVIPDFNAGAYFIEKNTMKRITDKNANQFTRQAFCFYKSFGNKSISSVGLLSYMLKGISVKEWITIALVSILAVLAGMIMPWANNFIFGRVIPAGQIGETIPAAALLLSAISVAVIFRLWQSFVLTNCTLRINTYVQSGIYSRLLSLKTEFFKTIKAGELSNTITEFSNLSRVLSVRSIAAFICLILSMVYLFQIGLYAPQLLGFVLIMTAVMLIIIIIEGIQSMRWNKRYTESLSRMSGFCYEMFAGIEQIKLSGSEARIMNRWSNKYLDVSRNEDKPVILRFSDGIFKTVTVVSTAFIFFLGSQLPASQYIAFSVAYGAYMAAILQSGEIIRMISAYKSAYDLVKPMLTGECEEYGEKKIISEKIEGEITISDLCFGYDKNEEYVIKDLSMHIAKGKSIGITGTSGCGKSTLIRLLLGFETSDRGSIYIDDYDIRELDLRSYRKKIGVVLQNASLTYGDIYSNITMVKPDAKLDEVWRAIEIAGLRKDIEELPLGLHTPLSEENCILSGGQRQRIFIARAILSEPALLIFDEATSALDNLGQQEITERINQIDGTKIIIAHRLSTIRNCDCIYVMDQGKIVESGTYEELMENKGLFAKLAEKQIAEE